MPPKPTVLKSKKNQKKSFKNKDKKSKKSKNDKVQRKGKRNSEAGAFVIGVMNL